MKKKRTIFIEREGKLYFNLETMFYLYLFTNAKVVDVEWWKAGYGEEWKKYY